MRPDFGSSSRSGFALCGEILEHVVPHATVIRDSEAKRMAGITNGNGVQIFRCFLDRKGKATGSWKIAVPW
jgi:hypothetical protein